MNRSSRRRSTAAALAAAIALGMPAAHGQSADATTPDDSAAGAGSSPALARVEVTARHYDNAVGSSDSASEGTIEAGLLRSRPALRPGEVLEFVPGMIVTQQTPPPKPT